MYYGIKYNFPKEPKLTWAGRAKALWYGIPALGIPVVLMGGILTGIVTPTEAANISIIYALIVGPIMMRGFPPLKEIYKSSVGVCTRTSTVMFAVGASVIFGWILAIAQVPEAIAEFITTYTSSKILIIAGMLFTYLAIGTFLDAIPIILIFTPIFLPLGREAGHPGGGLHGHHGLRVGHGLGQPPLRLLFVGRRGHRRHSGGEIHLGTDSVPECDDRHPGADCILAGRHHVVAESLARKMRGGDCRR